MNRLSTTIRLIASLVLAAAATTANAIPVVWDLSAAFNDGGTVTGTYTYDASTNVFSNATFTTTAGTALPGTSYDTADLGAVGFGLDASTITAITNFGLADLSGQNILSFALVAAMTDAGGTIAIAALFPSFEGICSTADCGSGSIDREVAAGGQIVSRAAVPEPATLTLMALALLGARGARRRQIGSAR
ncbi:MAG: PEP-CTERM sorting domain-containing protein [Chromatiaceae bacterium]|nr:PEP-CTERM sorting domain-containing protein [Gammaproteobacteria bacterium]MCP5306049.1 PEP-CTERM sorting domain-containing protein [Chromatiaceae bacterium]MCP5316035.1 PEP-CTERM sorting domain-containing protein [Chromatiaceae bacterium]